MKGTQIRPRLRFRLDLHSHRAVPGRLPALLVLAAVGALLAGTAVAGAQQGAAPPAGPHDATVHHPFKGIDQWVRVFDDPERDKWQKPQETVEALHITPGMTVADLGAGTGYFNRYLSKAVGPRGMVLALDTEIEMVQHMAQRNLHEKLTNVLPVLVLPENPFLPSRRLDRILIVDTYHHIDDRLNYFGRMKGALTPGGSVIVIDYFKRQMPVGPAPEHKIARDFVIQEMKQAGYVLAREETFLPYQYFLVFEPVRG
jgi:predicted methyltransferase